MARITRRNWSRNPWMLLSKDDLIIEREQCSNEGRDISPLQDELEYLIAQDLDLEENQERAESLLDAIQSLPESPASCKEPSNLEAIRAERPSPIALPTVKCSNAELMDKALGGWLGRACGCLLGKPAEGRRAWQMEKYLKFQNRWPLDAYFSANAPDDLANECGFDIRNRSLFEEGIEYMPEDDDTNYTVTGMAIVKQYGKDFTPEDTANFWLSNIPLFHVCTAERIAYRNLANSIPPPQSASFRNPYREWIGAQIRADFFGFVNPGNPQKAAEFAWRDASISHVKNGIYGEMWVAAMISAAYVCNDVETVIRVGLAQIPAQSRLTSAIENIIRQYNSGMSYEDVIADFHSRWNENNGHHWCHTISNAEIVSIALLWGKKKYGETICGAVMPGFDTDCNGATAGSILGVMIGADQLPAKWTEPLNDTLLTGVSGYYRVSLHDMARETLQLAELVK